MSSGASGTSSASSRPARTPRSSAAHSTSSSREVGYSRPGRRPAAGVVRPAHPLQERGEAARRADLAHQLHRPDVDAQLQRRGGDQRLQVAAAQPGLDPLPPLLGQAAVMGGDLALAEPLAQLVRDPLGHPPGVDEHQRGPVLLHVPGDQVQDLGHLLGRWRPRRARRRAAPGPGPGRGGARSPRSRSAATRPARDRSSPAPTSSRATRLDRPLGGRQPDPLQRLPVRRRQVLQPLQGQGQVRAALVPGHGVDLVHDHGPGRGQHGPAALRGRPAGTATPGW